MNRKIISTLTLALAALATGNVMAQNTSVDALAKVQQAHPGSFSVKVTSQLSREAVQADLLEAQRTGNAISNGEISPKLAQTFPSSFATKVTDQNLSRDAVKADLREAQRTGDLVANGETGAKFNEVFPGRYASKS